MEPEHAKFDEIINTVSPDEMRNPPPSTAKSSTRRQRRKRATTAPILWLKPRPVKRCSDRERKTFRWQFLKNATAAETKSALFLSPNARRPATKNTIQKR